MTVSQHALSPWTTDVPDRVLVIAVREGNSPAFATLYERHRHAVTAVARRHCPAGAAAEDIAAEAFASLLEKLRHGLGPDEHVRAYLTTTVRNLAARSTISARRERPVGDDESLDSTHTDVDLVLAGDESSRMREAFARLPERWRLALWRCDVEGLSPAQVSFELGLSPNAVSSLVRRAREGLRQHYLQAHLRHAAPSCELFARALGAFARGGLPEGERARILVHLEGCTPCTTLAEDLADMSSRMRIAMPPLGLAAAALAPADPSRLPSGRATRGWSGPSGVDLARAAARVGRLAAGGGGRSVRAALRLLRRFSVVQVCVAVAATVLLAGALVAWAAARTEPAVDDSSAAQVPGGATGPGVLSSAPGSSHEPGGTEHRPGTTDPESPMDEEVGTPPSPGPPPVSPGSSLDITPVGDLVPGDADGMAGTPAPPVVRPGREGPSPVTQPPARPPAEPTSPTQGAPVVLTSNGDDFGDLVVGRAGVVGFSLANPAGARISALRAEILLPPGVTLADRRSTVSDGVGWVCTAKEGEGSVSCGLDELLPGATTTAVVPVDVSPALVDHVVPATIHVSGPGMKDLEIVQDLHVTAQGMGARFVAAGGFAVTEVGAPVLHCAAHLTGCSQVAAGATTGSARNNNAWSMVAVDERGTGTTSSSAVLRLPAGSQVVSARLYWAGRCASDPRKVRIQPPGTGAFAPAGRAEDADLDRSGTDYQASIDVTAVVAAHGAGEWAVADVCATPGTGRYGGWALVVVHTDPAADDLVVLFDGYAPVLSPAAPRTFTVAGRAGASARVGAVAWEGDAGSAGDRLLFDDVPLTPRTWSPTGPPRAGSAGNAFDSTATGSRYVNSLGVDVKAFEGARFATSRATVTATTTGDQYFVGALTVSTPLGTTASP
ncbi:sigma-70 family RNA polymerase sigma factor [Oerskovia enterophila]|uniref:ECF RNA polymerase sigma-E factor n=3 Tax=Oerskovia enterophila TaxID=43678 RepID=A0A163QMK9_9CELL|nr:sigma-70 family RNA polymerase sigma factor [Oerskovia enterophila]KZM34333.1 ECF RNA polymerase sigma-E factor [Oerskovia enterophila]